jgi:hypothetical protein
VGHVSNASLGIHLAPITCAIIPTIIITLIQIAASKQTKMDPVSNVLMAYFYKIVNASLILFMVVLSKKGKIV